MFTVETKQLASKCVSFFARDGAISLELRCFSIAGATKPPLQH